MIFRRSCNCGGKTARILKHHVDLVFLVISTCHSIAKYHGYAGLSVNDTWRQASERLNPLGKEVIQLCMLFLVLATLATVHPLARV